MKVLVDAHMVGTNEGGNERYIASIVKALGKSIRVDALVRNKELPLTGAKHSLYTFPSNLLRYLVQIPKMMFSDHYDLVLTTYFVSPFVANKNVIMVHDLLPLRHPEYFTMKERIQFMFLPYSIKHAKGIIVPSNFVATEMLTFFPQVSTKIFVIPEAADPIFTASTPRQRIILRKKYGVDNFAVLVIASKYAKRPLKPVIDGLALLHKPMTIFVLQAPKSEAEELRLSLDLRFINNLSDIELRKLYNLVDVVIYPSRYEGFGLPILETMKCKTPIVTTRLAPIVAMAGEAPYYFELNESKTLVAAILTIVKDDMEKSVKTILGYNLASKYSWQITAKLTLKMFRKMIKIL